MASIILNSGVLPPPACYDTEQARFEAYVAAIVATVVGGLQWDDGEVPPLDLELYWLRPDANGRPIGVRKYVAPDGVWEPPIESIIWPDSSGGVADAYTATTGHALPIGAVQIQGRRIAFVAAATNGGASTLNVDGTGDKPITRHGGAAIQASDISNGSIIDVIYNTAGGGRWEMATPVPPITTGQATFTTTSEFAIPLPGSNVQVSFAGSKAPCVITLVAVCKTAVDGYSIGDEVHATGIGADINVGAEDAPAYVVSASATTGKITVSAQTADNGQNYTAFAGGAANWGTAQSNFLFKAYLIFAP